MSLRNMKADKTNLDLRIALLTCLKEIDRLRKRHEMWDAFVEKYGIIRIEGLERDMRSGLKYLEDNFK